MNGSTRSFTFKHPMVNENDWWRHLCYSDLPGTKMRFTKGLGDDWVCDRVRVFADGTQVLNDNRDFYLTGSGERWATEMSLRG